MNYRFDEFTWMANRDGFEKPIDVHYGAIHLGVIVAHNDSYSIDMIMGPDGRKTVKQTPNNKFKTKEQAAKILHHAWKLERENKL